MKIRISIVLFVALTGSSFTSGATRLEQSRPKSTRPENPKPSGLSTITVNGIADIDPAKAFGSKDPVVLIEIFSDFQCPKCKQLFETTLTRVMDNYITGATPCKILVVHRDFLISYHAYSRTAASYSRAAAHIGRCQEVEAALFANQEKWEATGDVKGTVAAALTPAEMKRVQALVDAKTLEPLIDRDRQLGLELPVLGTPTMVFHTRDGKTYPFTGMLSYDALKNFLDQFLAQ
jgi:protein-disulfide isomerase